MKVNDYVIVIKEPVEWDGAGESLGDRASYVGHVGRIVDLVDEWALVLFPVTEGHTEQRNIEVTALMTVGIPILELPFEEEESCS